MKSKLQALVIVLAMHAAFAQNTRAAVGFTITPAAVSNTYSGAITFQVTGLTNTETVVLQDYLDANTNGVIDAGDILWQQFQLTDGQQSLFHNGATVVTNFNVPGDTDGTANGSIAAKMVFQTDSPQAIAGKHVFRLFSPANHFTAITNNQFMVTNFPYAGSFAGNVVSNGTATTLSNAIVLLFSTSGEGSHVVGGAVANNAGSYTIKAPPGTYALAAIKSNYVADLSVAGSLVLGGSPIITNLSLLVATRSISGRIADANNSGLGVTGFLVPAQTQGGLLAVAFTDTNGNFTERVTADQWKLESNDQGLMPYGYLGLQNSVHVDTTGGSVSGVTNPVPKAAAIFYGSIKDNSNHGLVGISLFSQQQDSNYLYESQAFTDVNGNYVAGALAGNWDISISSDSNPMNYVFSPGGNTTLTNGQAYRQNFTAYLATNHLTGHVSFNGTPVANVQINADANIGVNHYQAQATTDNNGNYSMNVVNTNTWNVNVSCNGGNNSLDDILGNGNYVCPSGIGVGINNNNGTADFVVQPIEPLQVTTAALPPGALGVFYSAQVQVSGGTPFTPGFPYGGNLLGGTLPPGLDISEGAYTSSSGNFVFSGTPTQSGTFPFVAVAYDAANTQITNSYSITINPILSSPTTLAGGMLQLSLNGSTGDYFTIEFSTNLVNWVPLLVTNPPNAQPLRLNFQTINKTGFYQAYQSGIAAGQSIFSFGGTQLFSVTVTNGAATAIIPVTRTGGLANDICVNYSTSGGTADGTCDYTPVSGTLCFAPNVTTNSISIPVSLGCDPTVQSATVNLVLSDSGGTNVITAVLVIQRPKPVLAVYPSALTLVVPGNCGQSITISNAGPEGSVLNYLVFSRSMGNELIYNGNGDVASGSLPAGQTTQIPVQVSDQFATNWIWGAETAPCSILAPDAANASEYFVSVTIEPKQSLQALSVSYTNTFNFTDTTTSSIPIQTIVISNASPCGTLNYVISNNIPWLGISQTQGSIAEGGANSIAVYISGDSFLYADAIYQGSIYVSDANNSTNIQRIPVSLTIGPAQLETPMGLVALGSGASANAWVEEGCYGGIQSNQQSILNSGTFLPASFTTNAQASGSSSSPAPVSTASASASVSYSYTPAAINASGNCSGSDQWGGGSWSCNGNPTTNNLSSGNSQAGLVIVFGVNHLTHYKLTGSINVAGGQPLSSENEGNFEVRINLQEAFGSNVLSNDSVLGSGQMTISEVGDLSAGGNGYTLALLAVCGTSGIVNGTGSCSANFQNITFQLFPGL